VNEEVRDEVATETPAPSALSSALSTGETPAETPTRAEAFISGGAYGVLAVGGAALGVAGSFWQDVDLGPVPLLAIFFVLLNFGAFRLAGWAMGTRLGAVVPAVGWLVVVIFMSSKRPEGDLVISGSAAGYVFLLGGAIAAVVAIARSRPTRNWIIPASVPPR
jgi:hypothetical protein